jgi:hypothetical protein
MAKTENKQKRTSLKLSELYLVSYNVILAIGYSCKLKYYQN